MEFFKNHKIKVSVIGGALVIATAYGTCTIDPDETAIKEEIQTAIEEKKSDEPKADEKEVKLEEPKADAKEADAKESSAQDASKDEKSE